MHLQKNNLERAEHIHIQLCDRLQLKRDKGRKVKSKDIASAEE
jgi:hypothetical protein